jgi:hypothetical protein
MGVGIRQGSTVECKCVTVALRSCASNKSTNNALVLHENNALVLHQNNALVLHLPSISVYSLLYAVLLLFAVILEIWLV